MLYKFSRSLRNLYRELLKTKFLNPSQYEHYTPSVSKDKKGRVHHVPLTTIYFDTVIGSLKNQSTFKDVNEYCMFIGYPKSGHSLVGSLIDAHPNAIIAHEADILGLLQHGRFNQKQIFSFILDNSRRFAQKGRSWSGSSYKVDTDWQGRFEKLTLIGDKKGGGSTERLIKNPDLLDALQKAVKVKVKYIHHVRNSFDNISTISRIKHITLEQSIDYYFSLCEGIEMIKSKVPKEDVFENSHEFLIEQPKAYIAAMCAFLKLECTEDYLNRCTELLFARPRQSRHKFPWNTELINSVLEKGRKFTFLKDYTFEN